MIAFVKQKKAENMGFMEFSFAPVPCRQIFRP